MERSINTELLETALGNHTALPTSDELARLLADAELALLLRDGNIPDRLLATGWYLHGVASSKHALKLYGIGRQRAAFQVAGHIFDLKLYAPEISPIERLKYCFAAQIAYARGSLDPNALALYRREHSGQLDEPTLIPNFQLVSLSCGVAFLGFDVNYVYQLTKSTEEEVRLLVDAWEVDDISSTIYGAAAYVASGTRDLMNFLIYGKSDLLARARGKLRTAITAEAAFEDDLSRWIAAHLLYFTDNLENSSIWNVLPPEVPRSVRQAFIQGEPRILTLWPPQIDFLGIKNAGNPLETNVKRLLLSTPTSGGKTLAAQLLITTHLSTTQTSVCYVAPTRSLCREVRKSLQSRLRFIDRQIIDGLPEGDWFDDILSHPAVEVMTPERLSYLLRTNSEQVLNQFGMFIFDEVHLIGDRGRGWTLEEDISYLHHSTDLLHHKIVLISAVIGNRNHIIQWLGKSNNNQSPVAFHSDWRGPRRIHGIWTTEAAWESSLVQRNDRAKEFIYRKSTPLFGRLDVRISHTGQTNTLRTQDPIGKLILKARSEQDSFSKDKDNSTPFHEMLVPIVDYLAEFGPVLAIEATKSAAIKLAEAIAKTKEPLSQQSIINLLDLVSARLGIDHPLRQCLAKGVAYHHGSLPSEIRNALEEAVSTGILKYIVATTTLTEGINLPVTSVLIAAQGSYGRDGYNEYIVGSKLVNAIGRAGRATMETEGIVVLARQAQLSNDDFKRLNPDESELQVYSALATEEALEALAAFEELQRLSDDAIFEASNNIVADFLKYIWFLASQFERNHLVIQVEEIEEALEKTLAWIQLDPHERSRWLQVANLGLNKYQNTEKSTRRRWASSGTSISSSRILEEIAQSLFTDIEATGVPNDIIGAVEIIGTNGRLQRILDLPEAPKRDFYTKRAGRQREKIHVPLERLLANWLNGMPLVAISETYLSNVANVEFRLEQLGDYIYSWFEIFLPWVFGTIIGWVNEMLLTSGSDSFLPTSIPANIRYGVGDAASLDLMLRGIQSRDLAVKISRAWQSNDREITLISWIRSLTLEEWTDLFDASINELRNLIEISRLERGGVAVRLFNTGSAELEVDNGPYEYPRSEVYLQRTHGSEFSPVGIWDTDTLVGSVNKRDQPDIINILNTGLPLFVEFSATAGTGLLEIRLIEPE